MNGLGGWKIGSEVGMTKGFCNCEDTGIESQ
jgi:hypothetical protein